MIFYKNLKKHKKTVEKNIVFSIFRNGIVSDVDDSIGKANECKSFFNISVQDGALKNGYGFSDLSVPASTQDLNNCHTFNIASKMKEIQGIWTVRFFNQTTNQYDYLLYLMDPNFKLWKVSLIDEYMGMVRGDSIKLKSEPTYQCSYRIDNDDCVIFFSNEGMLFKAASSEGLYDNVPALISCVVHYDNFFGITNTNRNTLIYTTNLNLKTWEEGEKSTIEFLDNRGSFNKLVAFNDYVYLFREYGITKISIYSTKADFSFTHLYTSTSKIYENSVCVCGEKVFFMTRDGLYSFNGNSVDKVAERYDSLFSNLDNANCTSAALNGKYYLATHYNFGDEEAVGCEGEEHVNNVLFEIDVENFDLQIYRGVDIKKLVSVDNPYMSKLCACFRGTNKGRIGQLDYSGQTFESSTKKEWKSFSTDLGFQDKRKKVKEVVMTTLYPVTLEIVSDEEKKKIQFLGNKKPQKVQISVFGREFQFIFSTDEQNCNVKKPMIVFDVEK